MAARIGRCAAGLAAVLIIGALPPLSAQQVDVWSRPIQVERSRSLDFIHYRVSLTFDLDAMRGPFRLLVIKQFIRADAIHDSVNRNIAGAVMRGQQ